jgi:ribosomal protein S18 acetylase RimI-like enzyme
MSAPNAPATTTIRPGTPADLDAIVALEQAAFATDRISRRSFARLLGRPSAAVLVAERGRMLLGCAVVLFRAFSRRARLYSLAVAPAVAGQGIGGRLLGAAEDAAIEKGCVSLGLEVRADNRAALGLYQRRDYRLIGRTEDYYSDGAAALHFLKFLAAA